jgi:thioredoxin-dependent peroxiredoxin
MTLSLQSLAQFSLLNDAGQPVALDSFVGRRVLLFVFPKADTPGCTTQACGFRDAFPKIEEAGAVVIGLSPDAPAALAKWRKKENLPYILLSDPTHSLIEHLGAWGERSMYGRKFMGVIRSHFVFAASGNLDTAQIKTSPADSISKGVQSLLQPIS